MSSSTIRAVFSAEETTAFSDVRHADGRVVVLLSLRKVFKFVGFFCMILKFTKLTRIENYVSLN